MHTRRLTTDVEALSDVPVAETFTDEVEHLSFPGSEGDFADRATHKVGDEPPALRVFRRLPDDESRPDGVRVADQLREIIGRPRAVATRQACLGEPESAPEAGRDRDATGRRRCCCLLPLRDRRTLGQSRFDVGGPEGVLGRDGVAREQVA